MTGFTDFVEAELPKRPTAPVDGAQGDVFIREGQGPRQGKFVKLGEVPYDTNLVTLYQISKL